MARLWDFRLGAGVNVADERVGELIGSGDYAFIAGQEIVVQDDQGKLVKQEIGDWVAHNQERKTIVKVTATLENGEKISVTANHALLVFEDLEASAHDRSKIVYAAELKAGMKFRTLKEDGSFELTKVADIKSELTTEVVYNMQGYHFNVVANGAVVSTLVSDYEWVPEIAFTVGRFVHRWLGHETGKKFFYLFRQFE